jgi:hypothetical protein
MNDNSGVSKEETWSDAPVCVWHYSVPQQRSLASVHAALTTRRDVSAEIVGISNVVLCRDRRPAANASLSQRCASAVTPSCTRVNHLLEALSAVTSMRSQSPLIAPNVSDGVKWRDHCCRSDVVQCSTLSS